MFAVTLKLKQSKRSFHRKICLKYVDEMAISVDPDKTAPIGSLWLAMVDNGL